mmetsp:Transcript_16806/g.31666  ORF Transcript_16806/g.31666 Transcript_16806/m.31666 type:complete len:266 (-) Transcript_16806:691-1488(-)
MILLLILHIIILALLLPKRFIQCPHQQKLLPIRHLIQHRRKVHGQPVTQHALHKHPNDLNVHPRHECLSVVGFAPPRESGAHVVDLNLELFEGHGGFSLLAGVVGEVFADDVAFFFEDLGEGLEEVDLGALDEFFAFVVPGLVHTPQNSDSVQSTLLILQDLGQRSRDDGRALLSVPIHLISKVFSLSKSIGIIGPVWPTIAHQFTPKPINVLFKCLLLPLPHPHKHRLQIIRILNIQPPDNLLIQHIIQIGTQQITPLPPLGIL